MDSKASKTSVRLSIVEEILGVTNGLEVTEGRAMRSGLTTLEGQVQQMNKKHTTLLGKDISAP